MSEKDTNELSDTSKEQISLNGSGTVRFTGIKREGIRCIKLMEVSTGLISV